MVAGASAKFWFCSEDKNRVTKEVRKAPARSKAIFAKPTSSSHPMPTVQPTGDTVTLSTTNEITPEKITDSYRRTSEIIPKSGPLSPTRISAVERNNRSLKRDTENVPTIGSNSVPIETNSVSIRSHVSNHQVNKRNDKPIAKIVIPQAPPMPPKIPSHRRPSAGLNNDGLTAGKANLKPVIEMPKPQHYAKSGMNDEDGNCTMSSIPSKIRPKIQFRFLFFFCVDF